MILFIDKRPRKCCEAVEIFRFMGILAVGKRPDDVNSRLESYYEGVVMNEPERYLALPSEVLEKVRAKLPGVPVLYLTERQDLFEDDAPDGFLPVTASSGEVVKTLNRLRAERGQRRLGEYGIMGICASVYQKNITYFDDVLPLSRTEAMVLRYLSVIYPKRATPRALLTHAHRPTKLPDVSCVRTTVCDINRKFREKYSRPLIVHDGDGYVILTPELFEKFPSEMKKDTPALI